MTPPMTPREKVARILFERGRGAHDAASWAEAGNEMQDWLLGHADAILTARASGSGDHAELVRLAEGATHKSWAAFTDDSGVRPHTNLVSFDPVTDCALSIPGAHKNDPNVAFIAAANPATVLAILAENAVLRGRNEAADRIIAQQSACADEQTARATEAERKLAEAVGVLSEIAKGEAPPERHGHYLAHRKAVDDARAFLNKEPA